MSDDLVAKWNISLPDGRYKVEFEHGTTSGRRVIRVNDKVIYFKDSFIKMAQVQNKKKKYIFLIFRKYFEKIGCSS